MGKNTEADKTDAAAEMAAENARLKAQLEELKALAVNKPTPAELQRMLGVENPSNTLREGALPVHPETGKPYFNDLRPTGRA
jgi:hypothetical protein